MKNKLIIYGNGQMAKMLYHFLKDEYKVCGFTVDEKCIENNSYGDIPVLPFESISSALSPKDHKMIIAVGFIQMNDLRNERYQQAKLLGYEFINYIHSSVCLNHVLIGTNNIILDHASIHPSTKIGDCNFISSNSNIGHGCQISNACWINSGVGIGGESTIEDQCFIGINATIGQGIVIKEKSFIGANSLVDNDTESKSVYLSHKAEKSRLSSENFLAFSSCI